jgi:hypothetical protein
MLKRIVLVGLLLATLSIFLIPFAVEAQPISAANPGQLETPFSARDLTAALTTSSSYGLFVGTQGLNTVTWQTVYSAAPTTITVLLEGSDDCSAFSTIDTSTSNAGEVRSVSGSWKCVRLNNTAVTGGAGKTLTAYIVYSRGAAINLNGTSYLSGATFTGNVNFVKALFPDGTATAPPIAFSSATNTGMYRVANAPVIVNAGTPAIAFFAASYRINGSATLGFAAADPTGGAIDTGFSRASAGVFTWSSVVFASLGTPANGSFAYCSDCTIAATCAGAGNGALAKRLNGVWVCN